jgi:hypothetical protein
VQCSAVQCSAVQCSAVQCSAVQCCAVQAGASDPPARLPQSEWEARRRRHGAPSGKGAITRCQKDHLGRRGFIALLTPPYWDGRKCAAGAGALLEWGCFQQRKRSPICWRLGEHSNAGPTFPEVAPRAPAGRALRSGAEGRPGDNPHFTDDPVARRPGHVRASRREYGQHARGTRLDSLEQSSPLSPYINLGGFVAKCHEVKCCQGGQGQTPSILCPLQG